MNRIQNLVLLFCRYPEAGKCKTRLIPVLGAEGAADLHAQLVQKALGELPLLAVDPPHQLEIHYTGATEALMLSWLGSDYKFLPQHPGDLGDRMAEALSRHLGRARKILLIGSDCPDLDHNLLNQAFIALDRHQLVVGPAHDGGYYLFGCRGDLPYRKIQPLFTNMAWGGDRVFRTTVARIEEQRLSWWQLVTLHDIDTPEDLRHINNHPHFQ